jgi:hypothetical protein
MGHQLSIHFGSRSSKSDGSREKFRCSSRGATPVIGEPARCIRGLFVYATDLVRFFGVDGAQQCS